MSLSSIYLPACSEIWDDAFAGCVALATVSLPACTAIHHDAFADTTISHLVLTGSQFCSLEYDPLGAVSRITVANDLVVTYANASDWQWYLDVMYDEDGNPASDYRDGDWNDGDQCE